MTKIYEVLRKLSAAQLFDDVLRKKQVVCRRSSGGGIPKQLFLCIKICGISSKPIARSSPGGAPYPIGLFGYFEDSQQDR